MKKNNISASLIQVIEQEKVICEKATFAVLSHGGIGDWFQATVGVKQGCLLSPTLVSVFLERIMTDARQTATNFHFAHDIDGLVGEEAEQTKQN